MRGPDLSVRQRLAIGSAIVGGLIAILGTVVIILLSHVAALRREKLTVIAPRAAAVETLRGLVYEQAIAFRNYAITGIPSDEARFRAVQDAVGRQMDLVAAFPKNAQGHALFDAIAGHHAAHQRSFEEFIASSRAGATRDALREREATISAHRARFLNDVTRLGALLNAESRAADQGIQNAIANVRMATLVVTLLIAIASVVTSMVVARSIRRPVALIAGAADAIGRGSFEPAVRLKDDDRPAHGFRDELREAAHAFGRMAETLMQRERSLAARSELSAILGRTLDPRQLASDALHVLATHVGADAGAFYLSDEALALHPLAVHALSGTLDSLGAGQGLPGRAAAERTTVVVRDIPADAPFHVHLGIEALPPRAIAAVPVMLKDRVIGVLLLATIREFREEDLQFVAESAAQLAVTIDNALGHGRIETLASALQEKNEELHAQNEELHAQGEELQVQSEELQAQSEELAAQNEELHAQTSELHAQQEALARTNEALVAAETQKNQFLATLGHELRNPLAAIHYAVSVLGDNDGDGDLDGELRARDIIERQTVHLTKLVDDLLDVSRITTGKIVLSRRPLDVRALLERCVESYASSLPAPHPSISVSAAESLWIDADETRIEQVVTNLLANAVKFTPAGGSVSLSAMRRDGQAVIEVADTGIGIEPELLPRIFDFLVQGESGADGGQRGLGIGLTLVKNLVELHGGSIEAASDGPGRGTTVTVTLPSIARPDAGSPFADAATVQIPVKRSVVLVEDNADVRQMMQMLLAKAGHSVAEAHDGPTGIDKLISVVPDVGLVDLDLPGFGGCEIARRVRLDPRLSRTVLIALSGYGRPEDREEALAAGFDEHMVKPVDLEQLARAIAELRRQV